MKHATFLTLFLLMGWLLYGQQSTPVSGKVYDKKGKPVAGASIAVKDSYDGATADSVGHFAFNATDTGEVIIMISALGYREQELPAVFKGKPLDLDIILADIPNELDAVVITAGSFEASDEKKVTVLKPLDIVTTASANADVAAAMRTLPGTQQVGESAELFVRGGEGYETRQFIDGTTVANPFFAQAPNIASRGRFSPFLFKGTVFSTGGYSALYGQALSSALILESIDLPDRSQATASLSPLFVGGQYQHLAKDKKHSWGASAGYTNLQPYMNLVPQRPDFYKAPEISNADANFRIATKGGGMVKFYTTYSNQKLGLREPDVDFPQYKNAFGITNKNFYNNLSYKERLGKGWKMNIGLSYSLNEDDINSQLVDETNKPLPDTGFYRFKNFATQINGQLYQVRASFDYKLKGLSYLRFGSEYWYQKDNIVFGQNTSTIQDHFNAGFAEVDFYITQGLALRAGLRAENSSLLNQANLAPRASLAYKLGSGSQVSADYGIFYQKPQNQWLVLNPDQPFMRADHYIVTYQKISTDRVFRTQIFQKDYKQLTKTFPDTAGTGNGFARGIEFFWRDKKTFKNFDYWLTYSYLDTEREYLNFPYSLTPNFAAKHTANVVVKRFFTDLNLQFNVNYQFATGRPYYDFAFDNNSKEWTIRDEGKTIAFNNLSLSLNYLTNIGKAFGVVVFSCNNVFNSKQVYGYRYSFDGTNKVPVQPPANRFYFLGLFLSWGVDRTQDAINNNL